MRSNEEQIRQKLTRVGLELGDARRSIIII